MYWVLRSELCYFSLKSIVLGSVKFRGLLGKVPQGTLSQMSRNFSDLFQSPQFLLYLRNSEVLNYKTSFKKNQPQLSYSPCLQLWPPSWIDLWVGLGQTRAMYAGRQRVFKNIKSGFENQRIAGCQLAFRARKVLGTRCKCLSAVLDAHTMTKIIAEEKALMLL